MVERTVQCEDSTQVIRVVVLRVGAAWLVGVGKRAPHGSRCLWLVSPHGSLGRLKTYALFPLH